MKNKIRLDARLAAIMDMVRPGSVVADIGCDHAYLVCALVETGISPRAFACDANPKPLAHAKKNIADNCLSTKIDTVLTNGLTDLPHWLIDTFVIAGMGGELIGEILTSHPWTRDSRFQFILQPMTKSEKLREIIFRNGFAINRENAVMHNDKVYTVMTASYTGSQNQCDESACYIGGHLNNGDDLSKLYMTQVLHKLERKAEGLILSDSSLNLEKAREYMKISRIIREKLEEL